ncbi:hypothetical protein GW17_00044681, partial [Ensete ventricosum]
LREGGGGGGVPVLRSVSESGRPGGTTDRGDTRTELYFSFRIPREDFWLDLGSGRRQWAFAVEEEWNNVRWFRIALVFFAPRSVVPEENYRRRRRSSTVALTVNYAPPAGIKGPSTCGFKSGTETKSGQRRSRRLY